jgi:hypothetical protein
MFLIHKIKLLIYYRVWSFVGKVQIQVQLEGFRSHFRNSLKPTIVQLEKKSEKSKQNTKHANAYVIFPLFSTILYFSYLKKNMEMLNYSWFQAIFSENGLILSIFPHWYRCHVVSMVEINV